ncbi:methyltransferase-like protein 25B isoform X1 [Augochlora pura]
MAALANIRCACEACTKIRLTIDHIFCILDVYGWLLDSYVVDFFEERLWDKLPESWRFALQNTSPQEFGKWLSGDTSCTQAWPLSLLALRQVTNNLQINRNHEDPESIISCKLDNTTQDINERKLDESKLNVSNESSLLDSKFNKLFSKHIKKKKKYEIQEIARVCANCAYYSNCKCIVDIGAGMGHLARTLAFQHGFYVTCIEQDYTLLQQARKWDQELLLSLKKHLPNFCEKSPQHYPTKLELSNLVESELVSHLQDLFQNGFNLSKADTTFGLVGLHPCGDLAPLLLRFYTSKSEAKFICIVGCCYMKLTLKSEIGQPKGYPLSQYLTSRKDNALSYTSLEVACHAIEKFCDKLKTGNYEDLIVHTYRATLETILVKKTKKLKHSQLRNVKVTKGMTFQQYCIAATSHFETRLRPEDSEMNNSEIANQLNCWQKVIMFGSLRIMLAPLVETVVLLDRFLFLSEKGLSPTLKPVFDGRLSPRNLVLMSRKTN